MTLDKVAVGGAVKIAPLGDPIELTVRGYELSIRKDEAVAIEVE